MQAGQRTHNTAPHRIGHLVVVAAHQRPVEMEHHHLAHQVAVMVPHRPFPVRQLPMLVVVVAQQG